MVLPVLLSIGYGTTELLACGFGKPLGFTEKQVMGPFALAHYPKPKAIRMQTAVESNASKELCRMCAEIEHQTPTENDERRWKHSGEFGEVAALLKRSIRDQKMRREMKLSRIYIFSFSRSVAKYTTSSP